jgi:LuxR family maltose regulon positive regulatory protein
MAIPVLTTKLHVPPVRRELVPRPRLIERLNAGLRGKLTLLSAPAGFGKTTVLSDWVAGCGRRVAWLSLDDGDNNVARFLAYFIAALQTIEEGREAAGRIGDAVWGTLQSPQPPSLEVSLTSLINEIAGIKTPCALVLDDYHLIEAQPVHDSLTFLLDHLPSQLHLIIATRSDPPLPLSRLRGRNQLTELRTAALRFTPDETAAFLSDVMGLPLTVDHITALEARTEGWVVGLQMAALALQGLLGQQGTPPAHGWDSDRATDFIAAFTGSHRFILDYLVEEVLDQQFTEIQTFLLKTSILDRLTAPLCDRVAGRGDSRAILAHVERANLFLAPLDQDRRWYRYHHLFADLLRSRLEQTQRDLVPVLYGRASEWYEETGLVTEAVRYAMAAGDIDRVERLVAVNALTTMYQGDLTTVASWLDALPEEVVHSRPWLCVASAWVFVHTGQLDVAEGHLRDAENALQALGEHVEPLPGTLGRQGSRLHVVGHIMAIRAELEALRGDMALAAEHAKGALGYLPDSDWMASSVSNWTLGTALGWCGDLQGAAQALTTASALSRTAGDAHVTVNVLCSLAALRLLQGRLHEAARSGRDALRLADQYTKESGRQLANKGNAHTLLSRVHLEWNDLEAAYSHATTGVELSGKWGHANALLNAYRQLAQVLQALGDADGALRAIGKAKQIAQGLSPWFGAYAAAEEARLRLAQGDIAEAVRWAQESGLDVDDEISFQDWLRYHTLALVLVAQGSEQRKPSLIDRSLGLLERLLSAAQEVGATRIAISVMGTQALAMQAKGESERAVARLGCALALAEPEGYVRAFAGEGAQMGELLRRAAVRGTAVDYVGKLLTGLDREANVRPRGAGLPLVTPVEPLSERELEVLRLLTAGLSNREIAAELFLAVGTVKKHTSNLYAKLNVHTRTRAVARARELGLL